MELDYTKAQEFIKEVLEPEYKTQDIWYCTKCSCGFEIISKSKNKKHCPKCDKILVWNIQNNA